MKEQKYWFLDAGDIIEIGDEYLEVDQWTLCKGFIDSRAEEAGIVRRPVPQSKQDPRAVLDAIQKSQEKEEIEGFRKHLILAAVQGCCASPRAPGAAVTAYFARAIADEVIKQDERGY